MLDCESCICALDNAEKCVSQPETFMQKHMTLLIFSFVVESLVIIAIFYGLSNNSNIWVLSVISISMIYNFKQNER